MPDPVREELPATAREAAAATDEPIVDAAAALVVHADEGPEPDIVLPKKRGFGVTFWVAVGFLAARALEA